MKILQSIYFHIQLLLCSLLSPFKKFNSDQQGQGMVEYALILALVAVVVIATLVLLGPAINAKFQEILNNL